MTFIDDYKQFLELTEHYLTVVRRLLFDADPVRILRVMSADGRDFGNGGAFLRVFDVEGMRATDFPRLSILSNPSSATIDLFLYGVEWWLSKQTDPDYTARQVQAWRKRNATEIEADPRYVAFRTSHDWIILHARLLADQGLDRGTLADIAELEMKSLAQMKEEVGSNWPDGAEEPFWMAGDPRSLFHRRTLGPFVPEFAERDWNSVTDKFGALSAFHRYGYYSNRQVSDDGPWQMDAIGFWQHVSLCGGSFADVVKRNWTGRPTDDLIADPRYQALKLGWDRHAAMVYASKLRRSDQQ